MRRTGGGAGSPVYAAGDTYDQYVRAPLLCMTRLRSADIVIDVSNGLPYFSPSGGTDRQVCLMHHNHTDQWGARFPRVVARMAQWGENFWCRGCTPGVVSSPFRRRQPIALASIGVDHRSISVIENGVEIPEQRSLPKSTTPLFVALSRLSPISELTCFSRPGFGVPECTGGRSWSSATAQCSKRCA